MITFLKQKRDTSSTTPERKKKLQVKENNHLFNHTDKLAADHDVIVSNTMIKITYKKALKDQNASDNTIDSGMDSNFTETKSKPTETTNLCNNDISFIVKSTKLYSESSKGPVFHSTPKPPAIVKEKKKNYVNGLNLSVKVANSDGKSCTTKVQKSSTMQEHGSSSPKKSKSIPDKPSTKSELDRRFLKSTILVKPKASIIPSGSDSKKMKLNKVSVKKIEKLENGEKNKAGTDKKIKKIGGLKRKASNTDINSFNKHKKLKINESKMQGTESHQKSEDSSRSSRKTIMYVDPDLPTGWTRYIRTKNKGSPSEQHVVYIVNKGRSKTDKWAGGRKNEGSKQKKKRKTETTEAEQIERKKIEITFCNMIEQKVNNMSIKKLIVMGGGDNFIPTMLFLMRVLVFLTNPQGKKFRFKWKLRKYLKRTNSSLDADQFFFGLYQRPKSINSPGTDKDEEPTKSEATFSKRNESDSSPEPDNLAEIEESEDVRAYESNNNPRVSSVRKEVLAFDPDLPFGWKRIIHSNRVNGRKQVHIISPDGKIFRRRYRLSEYLIKHQFTHSLDRFYFGLYPKKAGTGSENIDKEAEEKTQSSIKLPRSKTSLEEGGNTTNYKKSNASATNSHSDNYVNGDSNLHNTPLYDDPNLPEGWKRFIKIRSCGESAGRMEVVILSPDGRRHRSKKHLERYLKQKQLHYKAEDFDFSVSGKLRPKTPPSSEPEPNDFSFLGMKKKFTDKPVPELDISSIKEAVITPEGQLINEVNGLMMCSGLSSIRNERRQRLPRSRQEKQLKSYLNSQVHKPCDGSDIPSHWVQRLVKCRGDFRALEPDAAKTIAETTKEFIKKLSLHSLTSSEHSESGLRYEDLAEVVERTECLSFLKTLIPQKITFKEYIKLNRPKQFTSFT